MTLQLDIFMSGKNLEVQSRIHVNNKATKCSGPHTCREVVAFDMMLK